MRRGLPICSQLFKGLAPAPSLPYNSYERDCYFVSDCLSQEPFQPCVFRQLFPSSILPVLLVVLAFSTQASTDTGRTYNPVEPTSDQARANILVARQLQFGHFKDQDIDDELASNTLDAYLDQLDSQRLYFTQQDIEEFDEYRDSLKRSLTSGRLEPAFEIYNRYQKRTIERLEHARSLIENGIDKLDFDGNDQYRIDRGEADWAKDKAALDQLWRDRIRNAVLSMRLDGQPDEAIKETLTQRYESQLKRTYKPRSGTLSSTG